MRYLFFALLSAVLLVVAPQAKPALQEQASQYPVLAAATSSDASFNWAGYVAEAGPYRAVAGSWVVPTVTPGAEAALAADATWVGLGGVGQQELLQAGTQAVVAKDGSVYYEAWMEALPGASQPLPLEVSPGDTVAVSLQERAPGLWDITVSNITAGKEYRAEVPYAATLMSAEWIEEMPSLGGGGYIPLADFGVTRFLSTSAAGADAQPLAMINRRGEVLAGVSILDSSGGFSVTRTDAAPSGRRYAR